MADRSESLNRSMSGEEFRQSWQGRAIKFAESNVQLRTALLSLYADNYDDCMMFFLFACTGRTGVTAPYYTSNPKINKRGCIVADLVMPDERKLRDAVIFEGERQMEGIFRKLADRLKLSDAERIDLFIAIRHWVKADSRLDPTMDRRDPDAKRLVLH